MSKLNLIDVCKVYKGNVKAVKEFNLDIKDGEFVVLVGPSGCGKSTTLRMIAGLEKITSGKIYIDDKLVNDLEPKDRDIAMVFQNYALYPHLSVYENLAYSLRCHHESKENIERKVTNVAKTLDIEKYLERKPKELSGGQRQRVALGRCLIRSPKVFLFDEPLSNLDAKLRVSMRSEISKLHKSINGTFVYVTHDQTEAMTMGDRIVVMKDGVIQQADTPVNLYEHPVNVFVATFLGSPQMNIFEAHLKDNKIYLGDDLSLSLTEKVINKVMSGYEDKDILLGIRPSDFTLGNKDDFDIYVDKIELIEKLGNETLIYFKMSGKKESTLASLKLDITNDLEDEIYLKIDKNKLHLFNKEEDSIMKTNEINYIKSSFELAGENVKINERDTLYGYKKRFIDENVPSKFDGLLAIKSEDFKIERNLKDDVSFDVCVVATDIYSDKKVIYSKLDINDTRITFYVNRSSSLKNGDCVKVYVDNSKINICNINKCVMTINDIIYFPIKETALQQINKEYYLLDSDKEFIKNKYLIIDSIIDLNGKMILNVSNERKNKFTLTIDTNTNLFVGMILYLKHLKK